MRGRRQSFCGANTLYAKPGQPPADVQMGIKKPEHTNPDGRHVPTERSLYLEIDLLSHLNGNSVLIMDNMKSHHPKAVKNPLDSSGVRYIYLPPYRRGLNFMEKIWSKVKFLLRKLKARTLEILPDAIQRAFQIVSPSDYSGWFHFCGYSPYF